MFETRYATPYGVSDYGKSARQLPHVVQDVRDLERTLKTLLGSEFRFDPIHVKLDDEATRTQLEDHLDELGRDGKHRTGTVFILLSGHGRVRRDVAHFMTHGGSASEPGLRLHDFTRAVGEIKARTIVILLDFCFSGAAPEDLQRALSRSVPTGPDVLVLSSCHPEETGENLVENSLTVTFARGLVSATPDEAGLITWGDVVRFVTRAMKTHRGRPMEFKSNAWLNELPLNRVAAPAPDPRDTGVEKWGVLQRAGARYSLEELRKLLMDDELEGPR